MLRLRARTNPIVCVSRLAWWLIACTFGSAAGAQELEPRAYTNAPYGLNFLIAGFSNSDGGVLFDPSITLDNASIHVDGPVLGYARSLRIGNLSSKIDGGVSHVCLKGSADFQGQRYSRTVCGWSDGRVKWSVNFFGALALSPKEFASYRQNLVLGASLQLCVPSGEYDPARQINIGANRWSAKPELGLSKVLGRRWSVDLALAGTFYEANDEYYGGRTRSQDPIYSSKPIFASSALRTRSSSASSRSWRRS